MRWWTDSGRRAGAVLAAALAVSLASIDARQSQPPRSSREFKPEELASLAPPDRDEWQQPERIMDALGIYDGNRVADVGAGGGWFTVRLARRVGPNGIVHAVDVQPEMLTAIQNAAERAGLRNIQTHLGTSLDPRLPSDIQVAIMVGVYSYLRDPRTLLSNIATSLAPNGRLGIVEWKTDGAGGPSPVELKDRVDAEEVKRDAAAVGLTLRGETVLRYQYLLVLGK